MDSLMDSRLCMLTNACLVGKFNWLVNNKKKLERLVYLAN
jgi:hypothetical protein